jgi:hypothetical protein
MVGAPDPLNASLGRRNDIVEAVACEVGQLGALKAGPQRLNRLFIVRG